MRSILYLLFAFFSLSMYAQNEVKPPDLKWGDIMVDVGLNRWQQPPDSLEQKIWPSKSVGIYFIKTTTLSKYFSFYFGVGLGVEKISLGKKYTLATTIDSAYIDVFRFNLTQNTVIKNRLTLTYVDIPFEFRYHPLGTEQGEGFMIGVGGIIGAKIKSHLKWKYQGVNGSIKEKLIGRFHTNPYRLGVQVRFGFKGVNIFYKQYFTGTFQNGLASIEDNANVWNPTISTFGINLTGF